MPTPSTCQRKLELLRRTQEALSRLTEMIREQSMRLGQEDYQRVMEIDKQIEQAIGEKERCMGALNEHTAEHGC